MSPPRRFVDGARAVVGDEHVLVDPALTDSYSIDWTRRFGTAVAAVVRPGSAGEVRDLVELARAHGTALVPQGGNTGLVGGGVPHGSEQVVLSLRRLAGIERVDVLAGQVTVGAGVTLAQVQTAARDAGWDFGLDLAARDSATVGGMVATNAGGVHVLAHGSMRAQVVGVEAVLGTGALVARLSGLVKDNTGYDLGQLLCGSEGTLGIVTRARLRLVARPSHVVVGLVALPSIAAAVGIAAELRASVEGLQALELMEGDGFRLVADHLGVAVPVGPDAAAYLLVEAGGSVDPTERLADALATSGHVAAAPAGPDRDRLWAFREAHSEVAAALASRQGRVVLKMDVTLPIAEIADFCTETRARLEDGWGPDTVVLLYGHVGDGNIHVNVVGPAADDESVDDLVFGLVVERGGSISAEHGIGVSKKRWLSRDRSPAEVAAMRAIKSALDPDGILNPSVLFD